MASAPPSQSPPSPSVRLADAEWGPDSVNLRPWHFDRVVIPARGFDNPPCGRGMVTRPGIRILTDWAMSCCGIGVYEGDSPLCGRSPGRSVAVTVRFSCGWEHLWYCSLFDQGKVTVMEAPDSPRAHGLPAPTEWGLVWGEFLKVVFQLELKHGLSSLVMQVAKREVSVWDSVLCLELAAAVHRPVPSADPAHARDALLAHCKTQYGNAIHRQAKLPSALVYCLYPALVLEYIVCSRRAGAAMLPSA